MPVTRSQARPKNKERASNAVSLNVSSDDLDISNDAPVDSNANGNEQQAPVDLEPSAPDTAGSEEPGSEPKAREQKPSAPNPECSNGVTDKRSAGPSRDEPPKKKARTDSAASSVGVAKGYECAEGTFPPGEEAGPSALLLPNRLMLKGGNATAFRYELLSGHKIVVNYRDVFHMSLTRYINEAAISMGADLVLRDNGCEHGKGWIWMHETNVIERYLTRNAKVSLRKKDNLSIDRMETILSSDVLFVPLYTAASVHWSLLVIVNCKSLLTTTLGWKRGDGVLKKVKDGLPSSMAIHFDSLQSSSHYGKSKNIRSLLSTGLLDLWKKQNAQEFQHRQVLPSASQLLMRAMPFVSAKVEQQTDGVTCGWRTVDSVRFVAEHNVRTLPDWAAVARKEVPCDYIRIAKRCLRIAQEKFAPRVSNIPFVEFPIHSVVDEVCLSEFQGNQDNINERMVTFFDGPGSSAANSKKAAQAKKFKSIFATVAKAMKEQSLDYRKKMNKTVKMTEAQCIRIVSHIFNYPRGSQFATCLFYTRCNYPDSILVCTGLNLLIEKNPRVCGHDLHSGATRITKSQRVHNKMAIYLDWTRSVARHWDLVARFRLQELVLHFTGIAEATLKSCCREALRIDQNAVARGLEEDEEPEVINERGIEIVDDDDDAPWKFSSSVSIERGGNENGQVICSVKPKDIPGAIATCLTVADKVANSAITDCIHEFELHCKRIFQLCNRNAKLSSVKCRVTGQAMATIPALFSKKFSTALLEKIDTMWGYILPDDFIQSSLRPLVCRLLRTADDFYTRNGKQLLGITEKLDLLGDERIASRQEQPVPSSKGVQVSNVLASTPRYQDSFEQPTTVVKKVSFLGLGSRTLSHHHRFTRDVAHYECLALIFYLLQGCKSHKACDTYHCREHGSSKWGNDFPECQIMLQDVWKSLKKAVVKLQTDFAALGSSGEFLTFEDHLVNLRFDCIVGIVSKIADTRDTSAQHRVSQLKSDVFCYSVPRSYRGDYAEICEGGEFSYFWGAESDKAIWHGITSKIYCDAIEPHQAGIYVTGEKAMIGDFPIEILDVPKLFKLKLTLRIESSVDLWTNGSEVEGQANYYLGFKSSDCVRVVFTFQDGSDSYAFPDPFNGNYVQSLLGIVLCHPAPIRDESNREVRNTICVGPRHLVLEVMVQDNVTQVSGTRATLEDLVTRWNDRGARYAHCYVMPIKDLALTRDIVEYNAMCFAHNLPKPHILSILDPSAASAYEEERRKQQYNVMRLTASMSPLERALFPSLHTLEERCRNDIRAAALMYDRKLNVQQVEAIQAILYGWKTRLTKNGAITLDKCTPAVEDFFMEKGFVSHYDLKWWGSRSCFIQGPPGTGKTRMMAALVAILLEEAEGNPRILVACETNNALDEIFVKVLKLFRSRKVVYDMVLRSMVRIGSSKTHVVQKREVTGASSTPVDNARAVFTTFGSSMSFSLQNSLKPFDLVLIEEAGRVSEGMALHGISTALLRSRLSLKIKFNRTVLAVVGDQNQLHETKMTRYTVPNRVKTHFFDRVWATEGGKDGITRVMLTQQYRMNPAIASFVSEQFYAGKLTTPKDGPMGWEDDSFFTNLRGHARFPVRNLMVIDTSLEEEAAFEAKGTGRSYFNVMEAKLTEAIIKAWSATYSINEVSEKTIIITTYARQRTEIDDRLRAAGLRGVKVATIDELQGGEANIVIVSLVRGGRSISSHKNHDDSEFQPGSTIGFVSNEERINVALSRAIQGVIVIGFARHIARHSSVWRNFFKTCLENSSSEQLGTHGYFRLRYVDFNEDVHLSPFNPPYLT